LTDGTQSNAVPAKAAQGPALSVPREVLDMLDSRKLDLDRREAEVRQNEERLMMVRAEIEKLLAQNKAVEKRIQSERAKEVQQEANAKTVQAKALLEKERVDQEEKSKLARMYETMPSEDAAVRLERMTDRTALEILRLVKPKTAGAILGQVKPDRAAKLTEQLLAQSRQ
jgi:flagellar motility protein MotE (MotC chaperone)